MLNFLSKFLSKKPDDQVALVSEPEPILEAAPAPVVAEPIAPIADVSPDVVAADAADPVATDTAEPIAAPEVKPIAAAAAERPMHYVDPHDGMPHHTDPPAGEMEEFVSVMGETLLPDVEKADEDAVIEAMRTVYDPEIPVNIYDLGLIYTVDHKDNGDIDVEMSLTAPGCPVAGEMPGMVSDAVSQLDGVGVVTTTIVWDPAWTMERMSEDAKLALGMF